jgi:hypothetical protein
LIKRAQILIAGLLVAGLIVAGCRGGGSSSSSDSSSSGGTLSKDEFVAQADAVCRDAQTQLAKIQTDVQSKAQGDPTQAQTVFADAVGQIVPIVRNTVDQIAALDAPSDLKPKLDEFKTKTDAALDQVAADPGKAISEASSGNSPFTSLTSLATDLGLKDCGGSSG